MNYTIFSFTVLLMACGFNVEIMQDIAPSIQITSAGMITGENRRSYSISGSCTQEGVNMSIKVGSLEQHTNCTNQKWDISEIDVTGIPNGNVKVHAQYVPLFKGERIQNSKQVSKISCPPTTINLVIGSNTGTFDPEVTILAGETQFWDFGDGATSLLSNPVHTFANPAPHNVSVTFSCRYDVTHIDLADDELIGSIPAIGDLPNLVEFEIPMNNLTGSLSTSTFSSNPKLKFIYLNENNFSGILPANLFVNNTELEMIRLANNNFSGSLDQNIINSAPHIRFFELSVNNFSGVLPADLFQSNKVITTIDLSSNNFSGNIPVTLFQENTLLDTILLNNNSFTGTLPSGLFDQNINLINITMSQCSFSGIIPNDIVAQNTMLETLYLYDMNFTSGFTLANNPNITDFRISGNELADFIIDQFLIDINNHSTNNGTIWLHNQLPSPPTLAGQTALASLQVRSWNVLTD